VDHCNISGCWMLRQPHQGIGNGCSAVNSSGGGISNNAGYNGKLATQLLVQVLPTLLRGPWNSQQKRA